MNFHSSDERLIQVATGDRIDGLEPISMLKAKKKEGRLQNWEGNLFHLQYLRQTKEVRSEQSHSKSYCCST